MIRMPAAGPCTAAGKSRKCRKRIELFNRNPGGSGPAESGTETAGTRDEEADMRILFAEDDRDLNQAVKTLLIRSGYQVDAVYDGAEALDYARAEAYDGIILDWMMPETDGVEALRSMRKEGIRTPCLLLTARDAVEDRITGLDAGADDYLPKPFNAQELLARVRAMLRRRDAYVPDVVTLDGLSLDKGTGELRFGGKSIRLTGKTFQMMTLFMENPRILFSVQQLMDKIWGWESEAEVSVVWVNISTLRRKLAELGAGVEIRAQRGMGYSLEKKE